MHPLVDEPLLSDGDLMSLNEFLDRWERMPGLKFAELLDGVVYMPSPLSLDHSDMDCSVAMLLRTYGGLSGVCQALVNPTCLIVNNAPQPDCLLRIRPEYGGVTKREGVLLSGRPELVVEVSLSSLTRDLGPKLGLYLRAGVPEYVAILVGERRIEWRVLVQGAYQLLQPDPSGILKSRMFPGLWIDEGAFFRDDVPRLLEVLHQGLASPEHARFVEALRRGASVKQ